MGRRHLGWNWLALVLALVATALPAAGQQPAATAASGQGALDTVSLTLSDVDVKSAVQALFRGSGKNYWISNDVAGMVSSVSIKGVPFEAALKGLAKSLGFVYRVDNVGDKAIYIIIKRPERDPSAVLPRPDPGPDSYVQTPGVTEAPEVTIDRVPLIYSSPTEILAMLGGGPGGGPRDYGMAVGMGNRYGTSGAGRGYGYSPMTYGTNYGYPSQYSNYGQSGGSLSRGYGTSNYGNYNGYGYGAGAPATTYGGGAMVPAMRSW